MINRADEDRIRRIVAEVVSDLLGAHLAKANGDDPPKLMTAKQIAPYLGAQTDESVRRWVKEGKIPVFRAGDRGHMKFDLVACLEALGRWSRGEEP